MGKLDSCIATLKDFHVELFYLLFMFALTVQSTVVTQLIEDKICLNEFGFSLNDCLDDDSSNKTLVLKRASLISSYRSILGKLPAIATTLFVGSWINNYLNHLKFIILMPCISFILQILILIGNAIYFELDSKTILIVDLLPWIFGTIRNTFMALQTYVVLTNPPQKRIIKFASIDVAQLAGSVAGQYCGGWILDQKPWFPHQVHNYLGVFIISLVFKLIAIVFFAFKVPSVYKLNERRTKKNPDHANHDLPLKTQKPIDPQHSEDTEIDGPVKEFFLKIFSLEALKKLFNSLSKPRPDGRRGVLLLLVISEVLLSIEFSFKFTISFQFAQKAYGWSNYEYSLYQSILQIVPAVLQSFGPRILIERVGISDITLGIMAIASHAAEQIITGSWLATEGYFAASIAGCFFIFFGSAVRSLLCNVVEGDEVGGIFSLLSVFGSIITLGTDWILVKIFNATLVSYPGLCYHIFAGLATFPFIIFLWIKYKRPHLSGKNEVSKNESNKSIEVTESP